MRTWQELTAAAEETGTWENYVGDGATVPWEVAIPFSLPAGLTLWVYKRHLDASYPAAFKLHDWLYTPYGSLIDATRDEADAALRDQILAIGGLTAAADSEIVYQAVRIGGGLYFGTSQTGFDQGLYLHALQLLEGTGSVPNIPEPPGTAGLPVAPWPVFGFVGNPEMAIKVVIVFQQVTTAGVSAPVLGVAGRSHIGGWTEHVWYPSDSVSSLMDALIGAPNQFNALLPARSACLNSNASILGVRLYQGGAGKGQFRAAGFPGTAGPGAVPQKALLCYCGLTGNTTPKRMTLRGIPDSWIVGGEFVRSGQNVEILANFGNALVPFAANGEAAVTAYPVASITPLGLVTLHNTNNPFAVGNFVTFRNVTNDQGFRVGGEFRVSAVGPGNDQFTIDGWTFGPSTGGDVRIPSKGLFQIESGSFKVSRAVVRKVGRPFELYRGRRSTART